MPSKSFHTFSISRNQDSDLNLNFTYSHFRHRSVLLRLLSAVGCSQITQKLAGFLKLVEGAGAGEVTKPLSVPWLCGREHERSDI
jgi:hypothetical protein